MIRSRVFVFLAIALSLAGCFCAETASSAPSDKKTAEVKVKALQELTAAVLEKARRKLWEAQSVKRTAEEQKDKAVRAELVAQTAAAAITAEKRKAKADGVAQKATEELGKCDTLYKTAKQKAEQASKSLNTLVTRARNLDNRVKNEITPAVFSQSANYAEVIASADTVTSETTTLSGEINALKFLSEAESALLNLQAGARKVQVLKYQAESLLIVFNIEAKMSQAKIDIQSITEKRDEINTIVQDMNTKFQSAPEELKGFLNSLCTNAGGFLRTATNKVAEADKCNEGMLSGKEQLDETLATLMTRTDDQTNAGKDATRVEWHAKYINGEIDKIKQALRAAETSVSSAKSVRKQMQDTMDKTSNPPVNAHLDKTAQNKSSPLTDKEKPNPKDNNSELFNNDKLRKMTKEITNNSLIGGEVPTRSAANDSAVTVFIPLLVILVMSAALH